MPGSRDSDLGHTLPRWSRALLQFLALSFCVAPGPIQAQPVIESRAREFVLIDDGDRLDAVLVDALPVDTYVYHPSRESKAIAVITDAGRQTFNFDWGETQDFFVRHRGRLYRQRLAPVESHVWSGPDRFEIPFTINANNAIVVQGQINGSRPLDLVFDTGASTSVLTETGEAGATGLSGGLGSISLGPVRIDRTPIIRLPYQGTLRADGVLGYNVFMGRRIAIDYGRRVLRVEPAGGAVPPGFATVPIRWRGPLSLIDLSIDDGRGWRKVPMLLDTGSRWSLSLQRTDPLAAPPGDLEPLGNRRGRKADGSSVRSTVYDLPRVSLGGFVLTQVQADVEQPDSQAELASAIVGNDFLKRFDIVIDYRTSEAHVRPNAMVEEPYNGVQPSIAIMVGAIGLALGLLAAIGLLLGWGFIRRRRRSRALNL